MGLEQLHEPAGGAGGDRQPLSPLLIRIGRWLFRHRSFTALPLIAAIGLYLVRAGPLWPGISSGLVLVLQILATLLVVAGCLLRLWVLGRAPEGTSGRGRKLEARVLVTWGAYAYTRNPLYLGNLLLCLGLCLEVRSLLVALAVLLFFTLQYLPIIRAEEEFLATRFEQDFLDWRTHVPCLRPAFTPYIPRVSKAAVDSFEAAADIGHAGYFAEGMDKRHLEQKTPSADSLEAGVEERAPVRSVGGGAAHRPPMRWSHAVLRDADTWFAACGGLLALRWGLEEARGHSGETIAGWFGVILGAYLATKMIKRKRRRAG